MTDGRGASQRPWSTGTHLQWYRSRGHYLEWLKAKEMAVDVKNSHLIKILSVIAGGKLKCYFYFYFSNVGRKEWSQFGIG